MYKVRILILAAAFVISGLTGCASVGGTKPGGSGAVARDSADNSWWYASFRINWPQDQEPSWSTDILIAHRIISPVLDRYKKGSFCGAFTGGRPGMLRDTGSVSSSMPMRQLRARYMRQSTPTQCLGG